MKIIVKMQFENEIIPLDYRRCIISYIKKCLTEYKNGEMFDSFYSDNIRKKFCFTVKLYAPNFRKNDIELNNTNCTLILSSSDPSTYFTLYNAIENQVKLNLKFKLNNNSFICKSVSLEENKEIKSNTVNFKFASPLCVRDHDRITGKDFYYCAEETSFNVKFLGTLKRQLPEEYVHYLSGFRFEIVRAKKVIVKAFKLSIPATIGEFKFVGDPKLLNYMYENGIGSRKNAGFGFMELAR